MAGTFDGLKKRWEEDDRRRARLAAAIRQQLAADCGPIFERYGISKAVLYGSVLEGRATRGSDVDLLAMPLDNEQYWDLLHELEDVLDRPVDLYTDRDEPAWVEKILQRGEVVYEAQS